MSSGGIYFNYKNSIDLGLIVEEYPTVQKSNEEFEEINVEGRNGSLIVNKGTYPNKKFDIEFSLLSNNLVLDFEKIDEWLYNIEDRKLILEDKNYCYHVEKCVYGDIKREFKNVRKFTVTFICESFLQDLEPTIIDFTDNNYEVYCNGTKGADTLFKIWANGNIQISVDDEIMIIRNVDKYIEIDSKLMQVRNIDGTSKDYDTSGDYITLTKGYNTVSWSGNISKIQLYFTNLYK